MSAGDVSCVRRLVRGATLVEWVVVMSLTILAVWAGALAFRGWQLQRMTWEAQNELLTCALGLEDLSWAEGQYPRTSSLSAEPDPPCEAAANDARWFWLSPDGSRFTIWRINATSGTATPALECQGWAVNEAAEIWPVTDTLLACAID